LNNNNKTIKGVLFYGGVEYEGLGNTYSLTRESTKELFNGSNGVFKDGDGELIHCRIKKDDAVIEMNENSKNNTSPEKRSIEEEPVNVSVEEPKEESTAESVMEEPVVEVSAAAVAAATTTKSQQQQQQQQQQPPTIFNGSSYGPPPIED
jgi:hypothetical protein